ncbi:BTB/POZ domain-containing protein [Iris pallida]|uniref:BTB/POZ domain-containing protein n=1 Tax=Iris pallida TaxID=29817 RepID=A0AAX6E903_IRIPA|nr:BTB/POZ domain-containing protein [Iris pallida]
MSEWAHRVETTPRLAQWRIDILSSTYRKSDPFKIGIWNWFLTVERNKQLFVKLYPEVSALTREQPPVASFVIKLISSSSSPSRKTLVHPGVSDKLIRTNEDFVWAVDTLFTGRFIVDVEFLDLKIVPPSGGEAVSIWSAYQIERHSLSTAITSLSRMLSDSILTDITITGTDGASIGAHRAVLAARSPVFRSMFSHDLKEKSLSAVDISDMPFDACRTFLGYVYGDFRADDFLAHRLALLRAADKYDMEDLKEACHESLLEDIDAKNVLERLQTAHLYRLQRLKSGCFRYLVNFGKVYEIRDEFNAFLLHADRELITEIFQEVLAAWKGF